MRVPLASLALLALLIAPSAAAQQTELAFGEGADFGGATQATGMWLLLELAAGDAGVLRFTWDEPHAMAQENRTRITANASLPFVGTPTYPLASTDASTQPPLQVMEIRPRAQGIPIVLVEAESLLVEADGEGAIGKVDAGYLLSSAASSDEDREWRYPHASRAKPQAWLSLGAHDAATPLASRLEGVGVRAIHFHDVDVRCEPAGACPLGGGALAIRSPSAPEADIQLTQYVTESLHAGDARLEGTTASRALLLGGESLEANLEGWIRLPGATFEGPCPGCVSSEDQTLSATGRFAFAGLRPEPEGGFLAQANIESTSARINESAIDPALLGGGAVAVVAGGAVALYWVVKVIGASLYTKLTESKALEHKRRRLIVDVVEEHAGCSFRELRRRTGIPSGTLRHHVTILVRNGVLLEHPHRSTVRFFPNDGSYTEIWRQVVQLREPEMMRLHGVVRKLGVVAQKGILDTAEIELGWSRSTTQHRLARLVADGAVVMRQQGRYKMYFAVVNERRKPGPGQPTGFNMPAPEAGNTQAA